MAQKRQNDGKYSFLMEHGSVQILFMLDDTYYTDYGAAVSWKTYLGQQLKKDGYRLIMGAERKARKYRTWTLRGDEVSDYVYKRPSQAGKAGETILADIEKGKRKQAVNPLASFGTWGFDDSWEDTEPDGGKEPENQKYEFETGKGLIAVLEKYFGTWMSAKEPFAFVISASDWLQLMEDDKKENNENFFWECKEIFQDSHKNGILLLLIRPIPGWIEIYNRVLEMMKKWEVSSPEPVSAKGTSESKWQVRELAVKNGGIVSYIPSMTEPTIRQMLIHEYLMREPEFPLDFSRLDESAKELAYLMEMEKDGREKVPDEVAPICWLDQTRPMDRLCSYLNRPGKKADFDEYLKNRPAKYESWGEIPLERVKELREYLHDKFVGEDRAIDEFCDAVEACIEKSAARNRMYQKAEENPKERLKILNEIPKGPPMVVFLAGPSRTGKSQIVKESVQFLLGDMDRYATFNGADMTNTGSASTIIGAPPGTVGYKEDNSFKQFLRRGTCGVFLMDEIHLASSDVRDLFMSMTEEQDGSLKFTTHETLYFSEIMIVYTSNNGCIADVTIDTMPDYETLKEQVRKSYVTIKSKENPDACGFSAAWRNRVEKFIIFDYLRPDAAKKIVLRFLEEKQTELLNSEHSIQLQLDPQADQVLNEIGYRERANGFEVVWRALKEAFKKAEEQAGSSKGRHVLKVTAQDGKLTAEYL